MTEIVAPVPVVGNAEAGVSASLTHDDLTRALIALGWLAVRYRELGPEYDDERDRARETMAKVYALIGAAGGAA